jgi:hypothetical protein
MSLYNDAGNGLITPVEGPYGYVESNSRCTFSFTGSSTSTSGNTTTVALNMTFTSLFQGRHDIYVGASGGFGESPATYAGTWSVTSDGLVITSASQLPNATNNMPYGPVTLNATGGTQPYVWSLAPSQPTPPPGVPGCPPSGFSMSPGQVFPGGVLTGTLSGTTGQYVCAIQVTDATPATQTALFTLQLLPQALSITGPASLPVATATDPITTTTVTAVGGQTPYTWSATGLPPGVTINSGTGAISGTPSNSGTFTVVVTVTDFVRNSANCTYTNVTVNPQPTITPPQNLPAATVGIGYTSPMFTATGGTGPLSWSLTGPAGWAVNATGIITGTPASLQVTLVISVTDINNAVGRYTVMLTSGTPPLTITTASLPSGLVGVIYSSTTMAATGGTGPYTWSANGLPAGLIFSGGQITGTPTTGTGSPFSVTVTVNDNSNLQQQASQNYSVPIYVPVSGVTPASLQPGTVGTLYSQSLSVTGGTAPYTWSATGLPGLVIDSNSGLISGTPSSSTGSPFNVTVTVSDSSIPQQQKIQNYSLVINAAPSTNTISGTVTGANGSAVLIIATVTATGEEAGRTTTGSTGAYSLSLLANFSYTVAASYCGYSFSSPFSGPLLMFPQNADFNVTGTTPTREYIRLGGRVVAVANCGAQ